MVGLTTITQAVNFTVQSRATSDPTLWYLTRALAVAAYVALSLSIALGMLRSIARTSRERLSWIFDEMHQFIALLAGIFVIGHLLTLVFDPFLTFTFANLYIPIDEPYRPQAVSYGVFALYGMVSLLFSSWWRRNLPYGFWRALHYVSFVAYALVTLHGFQAGSDSSEPWMIAIYGGSVSAILFLIVIRLIARQPGSTPATARR
jgi:methionine sulfoxide reductase heme-binding subunit